MSKILILKLLILPKKIKTQIYMTYHVKQRKSEMIILFGMSS